MSQHAEANLYRMDNNANVYVESGSVKRLSNAEKQNRQLRPNNKNLSHVESIPPVYTRHHNKEIEAEMGKEYLTDYPNEAPIVREHNKAYMGGGTMGGSFLDDFGRGFLMPFQALGQVASPLMSVAKAVGGAGLFPTQSVAEMKAGLMRNF